MNLIIYKLIWTLFVQSQRMKSKPIFFSRVIGQSGAYLLSLKIDNIQYETYTK